MKKGKWRIAYVFDEKGLYSIALQFKRGKETWCTQCEYYVTLAYNENCIPVVMIDDISQLCDLGYEQTYSIRMTQDQVWEG